MRLYEREKGMAADSPLFCQQTEMLLQWALDSVPIAIMIVDAGSSFRYWNGACERMLGIDAEHVLMRSIEERGRFGGHAIWLDYLRWVFHHDSESIQAHFHNARPVHSVSGAWQATAQIQCGNDIRDVELYAAPIRNGSGEFLGVFQTIRDLRERKKLIDQLLHAQKMETLGTLVSGVAHEINNPVNLLLYNIPLFEKLWKDVLPVLAGQVPPDERNQYAGLPVVFLQENMPTLLSDMKLAVERIEKIVSGLKSYSRFGDPSEKMPFGLNEAVENALRLAQATIRGRRIDLSVELSDTLPPLVGSLHSIEQVVLNLIINAVQAIEHAQGRIHVRTDVRSDGYMALTVADNGKGIDPSIAPRIFDPFVTDKQDKGGTGLGLSVSDSIVRAHGGTLRFRSQPSEGTTFQVLFPVGERKPIRRILVVDDDPMIRDLLTDVLTSHRSCTVEEAASGIEACIRLGSFQPHLLVIDLFMPELNGLEVCRIIRNDPELKGLRILVITGHSNHASLDEIRRMENTCVLFKPFDIHEFLKKVDKFLSE